MPGLVHEGGEAKDGLQRQRGLWGNARLGWRSDGAAVHLQLHEALQGDLVQELKVRTARRAEDENLVIVVSKVRPVGS